jgi:hypothetical protein
MVCVLDRYDEGGGTPTLSGWNISFAHAGGALGSDQQSYNYPPSLGGSGGEYGLDYQVDSYDGLPNSGGGGFQAISTTGAGGTGVVMIKYTYP